MHVACEPICQQPPSADPDKATPSLLLSCLQPLKQCPGLLRNSAWLALRSLSFQSWLQSTFYLCLWPTDSGSHHTTVSNKNRSHRAEEREGERKERISNSQEPDNSRGKAGNGDLGTFRMLKCRSMPSHGIPSHSQLRMHVHTYSQPPWGFWELELNDNQKKKSFTWLH